MSAAGRRPSRGWFRVCFRPEYRGSPVSHVAVIRSVARVMCAAVIVAGVLGCDDDGENLGGADDGGGLPGDSPDGFADEDAARDAAVPDSALAGDADPIRPGDAGPDAAPDAAADAGPP